MKKELKIFSIAIISFIALLTVNFIINQLNAIYNLPAAINPVFGQTVLISLIAISLGLIILPAIYILKLPGQPGYRRYLRLCPRFHSHLLFRGIYKKLHKPAELILPIPEF